MVGFFGREMTNREIDRFTSNLYLDFLVATDYPEQEPAYRYAKWYDLFFLLIPIVGFMLFILVIESRYDK